MKKSEKERKAQVLEMLSKQKIRSVADIEAYKLSVCHPASAGIDLGSRSNYVAVNPEIAAEMGVVHGVHLRILDESVLHAGGRRN